MLQLPSDLPQQVTTALAEDIGGGDITAQLIPAAQRVTGKVITREEATLCGRPWVTEVFRQLDPSVQLTWHAGDGDRVTANQTLFEIAGLARPVLTGERNALNFLQFLSATATATRRYADAIVGTRCIIWDTRKTLPGLRTAQKYAVLCGGGQNFRIGLFDQVLIKENHIAAAGSLTAAVAAARRAAGSRKIKVDVEVETMEEFEEALRAGPDIIMLDEFSLADTRAAVALNNAKGHRVAIEASGRVTLETVRSVAEAGVDYISIGSITKHVRAVDLFNAVGILLLGNSRLQHPLVQRLLVNPGQSFRVGIALDPKQDDVTVTHRRANGTQLQLVLSIKIDGMAIKSIANFEAKQETLFSAG